MNFQNLKPPKAYGSQNVIQEVDDNRNWDLDTCLLADSSSSLTLKRWQTVLIDSEVTGRGRLPYTGGIGTSRCPNSGLTLRCVLASRRRRFSRLTRS